MSVSGTGTVAFDWRASCEGFYRTYRLDYLAFFIDGVEQDFIKEQSQTVLMVQQCITLPQIEFTSIDLQ